MSCLLTASEPCLYNNMGYWVDVGSLLRLIHEEGERYIEMGCIVKYYQYIIIYDLSSSYNLFCSYRNGQISSNFIDNHPSITRTDKL